MTGYSDEYLPFYDATVSQVLGPWNYAAFIYIAFDPPTSASPGWIDVSGFVDLQASTIGIVHGRTDGISDPSAGTCNLTVDNSDGRWSPTNPAGAWAGLIRKGTWLRVDVLPPSGTASTRFVGFIQSLPTAWAGKYATARITACDRFALLANSRQFQSAIAQEWLTDVYGGPSIAGYWPLHEPAGALYASDVSGQAPAGTGTLSVLSQNVLPGTGLTFAGTPGPGFDQVSTAAFAPAGNSVGSTGALLAGSYLSGTVAPLGTGTIAMLSMFVKTTTLNQPICAWMAPGQNYAVGLMVDATGLPDFWQGPLSPGFAGVEGIYFLGFGEHSIADGAWHQLCLILQPTASGDVAYGLIVDGITYNIQVIPNPGLASGFSPQPGANQLMVGGALGWWPGALPTGQVALFSGAISDVVIHTLEIPAWTGIPSGQMPDWVGVYTAATSMWQGAVGPYAVPESCGRRVIRLAAYAGVPAPQVTYNQAPATVYTLTASDVTPGVTAFFNIPAETAHPAGYQQIAGSDALTCMRTAAHTEAMPLFVDRQGRITLQPSTLRQNPSPAFTIDAKDLDPGTTWADDFQYFANQTQITPSGLGTTTVNTNGTASQNTNGIYAQSVDTVTVSLAESLSLGANINYYGSNPPPRVAPLVCEVATLATQTGYGNAWYDAVLAADISTVVQIVNWPAGTPAASSSGTYYIEGYTETLGLGQHSFAWNVTATQGPTYQCDSPTLGVIDTPGLTLAY